MKTPKQVRDRAATFYRRNHRAWLVGEYAGLSINLQPPTGKAAETFALEFLRGRAAGGCLRIEQERIVFDYAVARLREAVGRA